MVITQPQPFVMPNLFSIRPKNEPGMIRIYRVVLKGLIWAAQPSSWYKHEAFIIGSSNYSKMGSVCVTVDGCISKQIIGSFLVIV